MANVKKDESNQPVAEAKKEKKQPETVIMTPDELRKISGGVFSGTPTPKPGGGSTA